MKTPIQRAADQHLAMAHVAKPKPVHEKKGKKLTASKRRRLLDKEAEALLRELNEWRDGGMCVLHEIDGARCGGSLTPWSHYIPQIQSPWLVRAIGNTFITCASHNLLHHHKDPVFGIWYSKTFGVAANEAIWREKVAHTGKRALEWETEERIERLKYLLDNRPYSYEIGHLIEGGFYGIWPQNNPKG